MAAAVSTTLRSVLGEMLAVDMAEVRVSSRLTDHLVAYGLGACIGLCLYDPTLKIAGMAHIVLPEQRQQTRTAAQGTSAPVAAPAKFVSDAIPLLLEHMKREGAKKIGLRAAMVGGAQIFGGFRPGSGTMSGLEIGERNARAVREELARHDIPLHREDVGGSHGRTVVFRVSDGAVLVKPIGGEATVLTVLNKALQEVGEEQ